MLYTWNLHNIVCQLYLKKKQEYFSFYQTPLILKAFFFFFSQLLGQACLWFSLIGTMPFNSKIVFSGIYIHFFR